MIMMPYDWPWPIAAAHRPGRLLAPHRQREQLPVLVVQVNPVLAPVLAVGDELEVAAGQRVERVRHPDPSIPIARIGCS